MPARPVPIGMFVGDWLPHSETFIYDQVKHQRRTRSFVCARRWLAGVAERAPYHRVCTLGRLERAAYMSAGVAPRYRSYLAQSKVRLIHAHFGTNGARALPIADALGCPLAVTFHGHDVGGLDPKNRWHPRYALYQARRARLWARAGLLLCASSELAEFLLTRYGAPEDKVVIHRLGIDLSRFQPEPGRFAPSSTASQKAVRILMIGRFVEKKGFEYGLEAFARVRGDHPDLELTIVGDGPRRSALEQLIERLGIASAVQFTGLIPPDRVRAEMNRADILLAPSVVAADGDRESGVIVIKEASASGVPTLGTVHGGIPEIIDDGVTGFLVPEREVDPLTRRLQELVSSPDLRRDLGKRAVAKMHREYDTLRQNERLEERLLSLLGSS